ncbi:hypothetical protein Lal_00036965 [Lupinus albus]|nr:hypothetical protein Lal_00036965 [Lupinus albus]
MLNPISNKIENVWESWSIRVVMIFSLCLQIFLTLFSPLRKRMKNAYIQIFIWICYLMAESAAIFCVGHISSNQVSSNKIKLNTQNHLYAFWAPFLLVHLGGPDTITAFSLEDNQLWRRHMLGFITQFLFCAYVFLLTVPGNRLWIPIILVFVAGIIKYGERIYAMYLATSNHETTRLNKGIHYIRCYWSENLSQFHVAVRAYNNVTKKNIHEKVENLTSFSFTHAPRFTLRVVEVALNFYYDMYFNKFFLTYGYLFRFVTITCLLTALGVFHFDEGKRYKQGLNPFDITLTYTLMFGAVALDIIDLFMQLFSDRVVFFFPTFVEYFSFMRSILEVKRTRWSKCKKNPYTKFTQLSTLLPFRRWSESISGFNMISYSLYMMKKKKSSWLHYFNILSNGTIFMWLNEVKNPFILELWEFIFAELLYLRMYGDTRNKNEEIELRVFRNSSISEEIKINLINHMRREISLPQLLIKWHIATHLCYVQDIDDNVDKREFSKLLSDYMIYLLVMQNDMIPKEEGSDSDSDIKRMVDEIKVKLNPYLVKGDENEVEIWKRFVDKNLEGMLARELGMISDTSMKWEIISRVWVQLLLRVALQCTFSIHVQHLSKGGELISLVRMLYAFL